MISACTRYVPGLTSGIVYRPAESARALKRVPVTETRASHNGAPVSRARTTPAIVPVSWARAIWSGNSMVRVSRTAGRRIDERTDSHAGTASDGPQHSRAARRRSCHMGPSEGAQNSGFHAEAQSACPSRDACHRTVTRCCVVAVTQLRGVRATGPDSLELALALHLSGELVLLHRAQLLYPNPHAAP